MYKWNVAYKAILEAKARKVSYVLYWYIIMVWIISYGDFYNILRASQVLHL